MGEAREAARRSISSAIASSPGRMTRLWGVNLFKRGFASTERLRTYVAIHELVIAPRVVRLASAGLAFKGALARGRLTRGR